MSQIDALRVISDAAYMADFRKSQAWDILTHYLELAADDQTALLQNGHHAAIEDIRYWQGVLGGLKIAQSLPDNILAWAKQVAGETKKAKLDSLALG